jgi:aminoglycoside phosphotransferase family enzyme/predicted kinase
MELTELIEALTEPAAYPYQVEKVEVVQTHISVVFLAGPFVYKLKKPVKPGFLDFSTLEKRRHFCEEEVRLNRRLAPDVYLGIVPIAEGQKQVRLEGTGHVIEWAVKMVRLSDEATLHARLERGQVDVPLAEAFACRIARFHRTAEAAGHVAGFEAVSNNVLGVLNQSLSQKGITINTGVYQRVRHLTEDTLARLRPVIETRAARGMTRDCHGDLHLDHVYYSPERRSPDDLIIVDCIEFNERFRFIDPVADMAFAAMDFTFHGRRDLAQAFAEAYFRESGDDEGHILLPLYSSYRAAVRGSVDGMKLAETEVPEAERRRARNSSHAHWLLALGEIEQPAKRPCLLLVGGLPGTGKSTLAQALAAHAGFEVIRSDAVRKELAGVPIEQRAHMTLYSPEWNERTYAACLAQAERHLFEGRRVLIDATFRQERHRRSFLESAQRCGVPAALIICKADPGVVRQRLQLRRHDVSDADWSIHQMAAKRWEPFGAKTLPLVKIVDTAGQEQDAIARALAILAELGLWASEPDS